ncbi:hypothetical protein [Pseudomonas protegens]|uniref:hypothetical protein n=1 Tax=Pseudomonas protegens TaxID=380021 RepID=UPI000E1F8C31|nr:hypothetical protein [Pseudomonas protegens]AXK52332.1 hypothetical protein DWF74_02785 [Pseudomonas protegens]
MSAKNLLQPLAAQLHVSFSASGRPYDHQVIHQLLHAAIGSVAPEVASKDKLPIQVCRANDTGQYNLYATIERAKKCLGLTDLQAVGVAEEVIESLRTAGIGVNQVRLLLDPSFTSKTRKKAFNALCKNLDLNENGDRFAPKTATLAIAAGIAPHPKTSWKDRFALAAASPIRGQSELVSMVNRSECYLWVFPPTDHQATAPATHDRFFGEQTHPSAEMGMGFSIIDSGWTRPKYPMLSKRSKEIFTQYSLSTPMWSWRTQGNTWRLGNILRSRILDGAPWNDEPLSDVLPDGLKSLPRIHGCATCRTLFIEKHSGYPDVPTQCLCGRPSTSDDQESPAALNS